MHFTQSTISQSQQICISASFAFIEINSDGLWWTSKIASFVRNSERKIVTVNMFSANPAFACSSLEWYPIFLYTKGNTMCNKRITILYIIFTFDMKKKSVFVCAILDFNVLILQNEIATDIYIEFKIQNEWIYSSKSLLLHEIKYK